MKQKSYFDYKDRCRNVQYYIFWVLSNKIDLKFIADIPLIFIDPLHNSFIVFYFSNELLNKFKAIFELIGQRYDVGFLFVLLMNDQWVWELSITGLENLFLFLAAKS
jgi:hypothetical protein